MWVGQFAYRERYKALGEPVQKVEVVKEGPTRFQRVKIRYLDGELEGLEEWVPKRRMLVPWEQAEALCADEKRCVALYAATERLEGTPPFGAAGWVFDAVSSQVKIDICQAEIRKKDVVRIREFYQTELLDPYKDILVSTPNSYVDRHGTYWGPSSLAEPISKLLCRDYSKEILRFISDQEEKYLTDC